MNRTIRVLLVIVSSLLLLACVGVCALVQTHQARQEAKLLEFERTAHRLGFQPTFDSVTEYIEKQVKVGMSRSEVEQVLFDIAPLEMERGDLNKDSKAGWGPIACDCIWLDLSTVLTGGPVPIIACYDAVGELVSMDFAEPDAPPLDIYAPRRE